MYIIVDNKLYTIRICFSCNKEDIIIVNSILDSYGGLGLIRTIDKEKCNCAVFTTNSVYKTTLEVMQALQQEGLSITDIIVDKSENVDEFALQGREI